MHLHINLKDVRKAWGTERMCMSLSLYECVQGDLYVDEGLYATDMHTVRLIVCVRVCARGCRVWLAHIK